MKINKASTSTVICCLGFLLIGGCLDINTTSEVKSDGTIVRTITFTGDSSEVYAGNLPVELDSLWSKSTVKTSERKYTLTATRTFRSVDEMNKTVAGRVGKTLQYRIAFDRSFRWFFTVYRYEETNLPFAQFTSIPVTGYLSKEEIEWFKTKILNDELEKGKMTLEDSLKSEQIKPRAEEWISRNRFEPFFLAFRSGVAALNDPALSTATVESLKDTLYLHSAEAIDANKLDTLHMIFRHVLTTPAAEKAWQASAPAIDEIKRKMEFEQSVGSHNYVTSVIMPGLITGSNARKLEANKATWQEYLGLSSYFEYTMWVESRQVNWWAVIVAVVVIFLLAAALVFSALRRRRAS